VGEVNCAGVAIGEVTYSNDDSTPAPKHNDVDGWCSVCGNLMTDHLTPNADGFYELGSVADVEWFAAMVNDAHQVTIKGLLTADIDYQGVENAHTPIGLNTTYKYNGTFDGQQHRIKGMVINGKIDDIAKSLLALGNIRKLQDEKTLTFLHRAPRIDLRPLNIGIIANNYRRNLGLGGDEALRMARMTKGYSFAFQVFGYFAWQSGSFNESALDECKQYLDEYAYEKIWSELSAGDKLVARAIAEAPTSKVKDVRQIAGMDTNQFNPYRSRLIRKGIVDGSTYGHVSFTLPLFDRYVLEHV
jgi:hypothetical protein